MSTTNGALKRYKPQEFHDPEIFTEIYEKVAVVTHKDREVTLYFQSGNIMKFSMERVSGLGITNLKYAVEAPQLFDFYLTYEEYLYIFCPWLYAGDFSYFMHHPDEKVYADISGCKGSES